MRRLTSALVAPAVGAVVLLAGCSSYSPDEAPTSPPVYPTFSRTGTVAPVPPTESNTAPPTPSSTQSATPSAKLVAPRRTATRPISGKTYSSVGELKSAADLVIVANADDFIAGGTASHQRTVYVQDVFKGKAERQEKLTVNEPGDGGEPYTMQVGPYYVLFLTESGGTYSPVGGSQGVLLIDDETVRPADARSSIPKSELDAMLDMLEK